MTIKTNLLAAVISSLTAMALSVPGHLQAQEDEIVEQVLVTGSRIVRTRQQDTSTPLSSYGQNEFSSGGFKDVRDLIQTLTINTGSQNNSDNLSQNFTVGTSNVNLRGLGVSSTLVLLNGKRQVTSSVVTDEGASFVDTASLVPALAIDRVEILKDGASAIYGSDAVAGVANFVTRENMDGFELQIERRSRIGNGSQDDTHIDLAFGGDAGDTGHFLLAAGYMDRTGLVLGEVDWLEPSTSGFGNPATYILSSDGSTVPDSNCTANGGILAGSFCRFDFGPQITAVPEEERLQGFARATWDWSETTRLWSEIAYARNRISREVSPSFPVLNAPSVLATHPDNPFGEDVAMLGRPYGVGKPTEINFYDHSTFRFAVGGNGRLTESVSWDVSLVNAYNDAVLNPRDVIAGNYQAALHGFGGENCDAATTAPGVGECLYFNPWSIDEPDNETLRSFIIGDYVGDTESQLTAYEAVISGDGLFDMAGGEAGFALGVQYREESLAAVYDSITQQDGWAFVIGNTNFSGKRDVIAVFGELLLPVAETAEVSAAVRYEDYGSGVGDTINPKLSALWSLSDNLSLRASGGTSFRAPSVHQLEGAQTNFANISDPNNDGESTFGGNRTLGDPNLEPETSTAFNIGMSYEFEYWSLDFDYWDFSFEDVLTRENHQEIVNADPDDPERVIRTSAGTVAIVNTLFVNANAIDTSGLDVAARGFYETGIGMFAPSLDATYVLTYDVTAADGTGIDGAGKLNRANVGNPTPELRANVGLNWYYGVHSANIFYRYVDSYARNDSSNTDSINSYGQVDVQYSLSLGAFLTDESDTNLTIGLINAFDEDPPFVNIAGSYDPRTGDPRGRRAYVRLGMSF